MGIACTLFCSTTAFAIDFIVMPSLTLQETYSDNVNLAPKGQEKSAFVTEISPGISFRGRNGGRLTANLDYRLQALFNSGGDGSTRIFNQLQFDSGYVLSRKRRLNVGLRSTISQQNTTNIRTGDNINDLNNRANVYTVGASANWAPHFGGFADGLVNIDFNYVANDGGDQILNDDAPRLSNSKDMRESVTLVSGYQFTRITWVANFDNSSNFRDDGDDVHFQNTGATIRGWVDRRFNFFTTLGYANNSFQGLDTNDNGFFYTVGAQWKPNWWFDIEAGYGNNWHVTSNFSFNRRTRLSAGYFDRSVGLNTGGAWNASFNHQTKWSSWNFTYTEDTTTVQQILSENSPFAPIDNGDNPLDGPSGLPGSVDSGLPFTNDVLIRRTANASVSYTTGKSVFQLGGFYQRRKFENIAENEETVYGVDASWNWMFTSDNRTNLSLSPSWQHIQRDSPDTIDSEDDRYEFIARVTRTLPVNIGRYGALSTSLEYFFVKQDSTLLLNTFMENRVTISLSMRF